MTQSEDDSRNVKSAELASELKDVANKYTHVHYNSLTKNSEVTEREVTIWAKGGNSGITHTGKEEVKEPQNLFQRDFVMRQEAEREALRLLEKVSKIINGMHFPSTKNLPSVVS